MAPEPGSLMAIEAAELQLEKERMTGFRGREHSVNAKFSLTQAMRGIVHLKPADQPRGEDARAAG